MTVDITYFVHGTSTDNEAGLSSGWKDSPLSALGVKQAHELKEKVAGKRFDVAFSSDLQRALKTAEIIFGKAAVIPDKRLRECNYGTFNGKPTEIVEPMQEQLITEPFPEGESYGDVKARVADFLQFLKKEYDGRHVSLVSHKAPQLSLMCSSRERRGSRHSRKTGAKPEAGRRGGTTK